MELECYVEGVRGMANTSSACQPSWTFSRFGSFLSTTITISYLSALHLCRDDGCVAARSLGRYVKGGPGMANTTRVFSFVSSRLASRRVFSYSSYRFCAADTEGHFWRTVLRSTNLAFSRITAVVRGGYKATLSRWARRLNLPAFYLSSLLHLSSFLRCGCGMPTLGTPHSTRRTWEPVGPLRRSRLGLLLTRKTEGHAPKRVHTCFLSPSSPFIVSTLLVTLLSW